MCLHCAVTGCAVATARGKEEERLGMAHDGGHGVDVERDEDERWSRSSFSSEHSVVDVAGPASIQPAQCMVGAGSSIGGDAAPILPAGARRSDAFGLESTSEHDGQEQPAPQDGLPSCQACKACSKVSEEEAARAMGWVSVDDGITTRPPKS